jgi:hypothetical protein
MARHGCEKRDLILTKVTHASLSLQQITRELALPRTVIYPLIDPPDFIKLQVAS